MRLREYEYLLAIARKGNMSLAAQSLFISQPVLSKLLAQVEQDLGVQLFIRDGRQMIPTPIGRIYLDNAQKIVDMNRNMELSLREASARCEINLAFPMVYSGYVTGTVLPTLHARHPEVSIRCRICAQGHLCDGLLRREFSLALGIVPTQSDPLLAHRVIGLNQMVLAVPKGHPLETHAVPQPGGAYPFIEAEALAGVPFLLPAPGSYSGRYAEQFFRLHRLRPSVVLHSPMTGLLYQSVASGAGVAILPSIPLRHMNMEHSVAYLAIDPQQAPRTVALLYRRDRELSLQEESLALAMRALYG
ncbi:MAG: LysR family transcriptional regulator [Clostridia bacterium]|nr:LysR family transcriptional regulator [Clostridia bacterium]